MTDLITLERDMGDQANSTSVRDIFLDERHLEREEILRDLTLLIEDGDKKGRPAALDFLRGRFFALPGVAWISPVGRVEYVVRCSSGGLGVQFVLERTTPALRGMPWVPPRISIQPGSPIAKHMASLEPIFKGMREVAAKAARVVEERERLELLEEAAKAQLEGDQIPAIVAARKAYPEWASWAWESASDQGDPDAWVKAAYRSRVPMTTEILDSWYDECSYTGDIIGVRHLLRATLQAAEHEMVAEFTVGALQDP